MLVARHDALPAGERRPLVAAHPALRHAEQQLERRADPVATRPLECELVQLLHAELHLVGEAPRGQHAVPRRFAGRAPGLDLHLQPRRRALGSRRPGVEVARHEVVLLDRAEDRRAAADLQADLHAERNVLGRRDGVERATTGELDVADPQ